MQSMPNIEKIKRTVFFVSDGTALTVAALGNSLLSQFEAVEFNEKRIPFLLTEASAYAAVNIINQQAEADGVRPLVFTTIIDEHLADIVHSANAFAIPYFETFLAPLEKELGVTSLHLAGRSHGMDDNAYRRRIEGIDYTLAHDDGISYKDLDKADIILIAVSRCGKTPTSLYLAMQFGLKVANFPLVEQDLQQERLSNKLLEHKSKLFGLTITPERLSQIREERKAGSTYCNIDTCRQEIFAAEYLMNKSGIGYINSSKKSIEEIAAEIIQIKKLKI